MAEKERIYTIPLRHAWIGVPRVKRANRAVSEVKRFLSRHMHAEKVLISAKLNDDIWKRGAKKPPAKVKVKAMLEEKVVRAMLPDEKEEAKQKKKGGKLSGLKGKLAGSLPTQTNVKQIEKQAAEKLQAEKAAAKKEEAVTVKKETGNENEKV